jgi:CheY-like chemotaxis protein
MVSEGVGKGCTFTVCFPLYVPNDPPNLSATSEATAIVPAAVSLTPSARGGDGAHMLHMNVATPQPLDTPGDLELNQYPPVMRTSMSGPRLSLVTLPETGRSVIKGASVLIVDDALTVCKLLSRLLTRKGAICSTAHDGLEAVHRVRSLNITSSNPDHLPLPLSLDGGGDDGPLLSSSTTPKIPPLDKQFDVILMDYVMPNLDGPNATRILREAGYGGLIIGATGHMMSDQVDFFLSCGADYVLAKPLEISDLERILVSRLNQ